MWDHNFGLFLQRINRSRSGERLQLEENGTKGPIGLLPLLLSPLSAGVNEIELLPNRSIWCGIEEIKWFFIDSHFFSTIAKNSAGRPTFDWKTLWKKASRNAFIGVTIQSHFNHLIDTDSPRFLGRANKKYGTLKKLSHYGLVYCTASPRNIFIGSGSWL